MTQRKTPETHATTGTARPDRQRATRQPDPGDIGQPPAHLGPLSAVWNELAAALPAGIGSPSDRHAFELLTRLVAKSRTSAFTAADTSQMRGLFESFGLTPTGRLRLDMPARGARNPAPAAAPSNTRADAAARFFRGA